MSANAAGMLEAMGCSRVKFQLAAGAPPAAVVGRAAVPPPTVNNALLDNSTIHLPPKRTVELDRGETCTHNELLGWLEEEGVGWRRVGAQKDGEPRSLPAPRCPPFAAHMASDAYQEGCRSSRGKRQATMHAASRW